MPLPIAIGGKCESSQELPGPCCHPDDLDDGTPLHPLELYQTLAWGVCPKNEWLVRVTTSYYDLVVESTGKREITMVEVRVQVSFLTRPLSPNYRETTHHLKLFDGAGGITKDDENDDDDDEQEKTLPAQQQQLSQQPQVVVSEDRRNLAVLLFHPHQQSSAVVIFQLRIPRSDLVISSPIPLPSYCATTGNDSNASSVFSREAPMIASHPRFVSVWGISTICSIPNASPPILLAICHDGGLVWLDVRSSLAVASGMLHGIKTDDLPFSSLVVAPTSTMEKGTLLAVSSKTGHTVLATWKKEKKASVEQTAFLRRASTGVVVNRKDFDKSPLLSSSTSFQSPSSSSSSRRPPLTTQNNPTRFQAPMRSFSAGATPLVQGALKTMLSPEQMKKLSPMFTPNGSPSSVKSSISGRGGGGGIASSSGGDSNKSTLARHFSGELPDLRAALFGGGGNSTKTQQQQQQQQQRKQKKSDPGNHILKSKSSAGSGGKSDSPSTAAAATIAALSPSQQPRKPLRRRRKADSGGNAMMRSMKLAIVSTLHDDNEIVDVRFASSTIVCAIYKATAKESQKVAQIYSLCEIGSFRPIVALSLTSEQVKSATDVACSSAASSNRRRSSTVKSATSSTSNGGEGEKFAPRTTTTSVCSRVGSDFDPNSGCFAINTTYDARWIGLIWNWRCNALGWTIQNSTSVDNMLWCRLYFGKHEQQGSHFAYLESTQDRYLQTRKEVVATGLLSPSDSYVTTSIEPCSLLLSGDSISFPDSSQMESGVSELEWKVLKMPFMYLNAYGPPEVAAVGRLNGNTLAVASSYGVCILDDKHRWKQFGSPAEEKTFSIVAMTWWEGTHHSSSANSSATTIIDEESDDLLVAVIQSNNGRQYLSCWSPHRLDLAHQLLETTEQYTADQTNSEPQEPSWGIPLTKSVRATNLSLLAEPVEGQNEFGRNNKRRAVVFVSSSNVEACTVDYAIFQLQLTRNNQQVDIRVESYVEQKPYSVLVNPSSQGTIKKPSQSVGPVSSLFLAGASFKFDLLQPDVEEDDDFVGLVGMIRAPGGIEAIALSSKRKSLFSTLIDADEISRVALVDIVHTPPHTFKSQGPTSNCFVWLVELLSGAIFTWSAPYFLTGESGDDFQFASFLRESKVARPKGLRPPTMVRKKESRSNYLLGTLCHVGTASDWMQQSSSGCQTDISLGNVPRSAFGCVLRAGQTSRNLHRQHVADNFETDLFPTDFLQPEVFSPTAFMMTPPSFVSSLYSLFLEAAYWRTEIPVSEESKANTESALCDVECGRLKAIERHLKNRLRSSPNEDAVMMALRLLIIRSVEMLTMVNKKHVKEQSDVTQSSLHLAGAVFAEIVDVVRLCTTNLQFASLFLEAGRQIEPSCLANLFPLPATGKSFETPAADDDGSSVEGRLTARTVVELFTLCVEEGSLAASASALPLMGTRIEARNYCDLLLSKSIKAFIDNTHSSLLKFDTSLEERRVIGDIFRYGMKLEDSGRLEEKMLLDEEEVSLKEDGSLNIIRSMRHDEPIGLNGALDDPDDVAPLGGSASSVSAETPVNQSGHNLICLGGRQSAILSYLVPSIFDDAPKRKEEEAIRNAAMSFIETKLEPSNLDFLVQPDDNGSNLNGDLPESVGEYDVQSVGGLVGEVIVNTLLTPKTDNHWKAMASLARLLLQNNGDVNASEVFTRAGEMVQTEELVVLVPEVGYEGEGLDRVVRFVAGEMGKCESSLNEEQARQLVVLVLQLIGRLEDFPLPKANHSFVLSGLLLVGVIAGHVAGRTPLLLANLDDNHVLVSCYDQSCSQSRAKGEC